VRTKVQLLTLFAILVFASAAHGAEYAVTTCNGQAAATGGWSLFATGPNATRSENCASSGGTMTAALKGAASAPAGTAGWHVFAPANTVIAGATFYRKVAVAGTG
jgi:hypothetical protein